MSDKSEITIGNRGLALASLDDAWRFATAVAKSGLAPKGIETPEAILVAIQMGMELGLTPMAALQSIAVINGRASVWGDAQLAICRSSHVWDESAFRESFEGKAFEDGSRAVCSVRRKDGNAITRSFSVADAKTAKLWGKTGAAGGPTPWVTYPARMLQMRARSFALRDGFGDVLRGFRSAEELIDARDLKPVAGMEVGPTPEPVKEPEPAALPTSEPVSMFGIQLKRVHTPAKASEGGVYKHQIQIADGEWFYTFSDELRKEAVAALESRRPVEITFLPTSEGKKITAIIMQE